MLLNRYILIHFVIYSVLLIKLVFSISLLIAKYDDYMYTYKIMIIICSLICDIIAISLITTELVWSMISNSIVTCASNPPFCGDSTGIESQPCGFFRPYYLQFTASYLAQTFIIILLLAIRESPIIPSEIMALSICTFILFGINITITIISCFVTIK